MFVTYKTYVELSFARQLMILLTMGVWTSVNKRKNRALGGQPNAKIADKGGRGDLPNPDKC